MRCRLGNVLLMDAAAVGVAQKEDREEGIDEQDIFYRMVLCLAALTPRLFSRVLGADDAPLGAVMGTRGDVSTMAGAAVRGTGSSAKGATTVAASAAEPLRQGRQRAGGGIAEAAERREEGGQEDVDPLVGFALAHPE